MEEAHAKEIDEMTRKLDQLKKTVDEVNMSAENNLKRILFFLLYYYSV